MCGRFVSSNSPDKIAEFFGASFDSPQEAPEQLPANFNTAPTNDIYAVTADPEGERHIEVFQWGLIPSWAKDTKIGSKMINARAETVAEKPAFKGLLKKHRLLVPMDGFYEWKDKKPVFIHRRDNEPLAVAGLWAAWRDKSGPADAPWLHSCTLITTSANKTMEPVHDRMPVILPESLWERWLDPTFQDLEALTKLLQPAANDLLTMHPVSTEVNNARNKGEHLIEPLADQPLPE